MFRTVKTLLAVTTNLIVELWTGGVRKHSDFYDRQTAWLSGSKGYYGLVAVSGLVAVGFVLYLGSRLY